MRFLCDRPAFQERNAAFGRDRTDRPDAVRSRPPTSPMGAGVEIRRNSVAASRGRVLMRGVHHHPAPARTVMVPSRAGVRAGR